jgi:dGTPase
LENFQRMLRVQIADTPFCSETGGIRGFQSRDPSVNRTAVTKFATDLGRAKALAADKLYNSERKIKLEIAGAEIIGGLLDIFSEVVTDLTNADFDRSKLSARSQRLARLMDISLGPVEDSYRALLCVTDFVSGMTDRYAVETYRTLKGIAL